MSLFAGIDVGSLSADAVLIDQAGRMVAQAVIPTGVNSQVAASRVFALACERAGVEPAAVARVVSTGYSRARVLEANTKSKTEISCHALGAWHVFPGAGTVIDIGGQDSKAIRLGENGRVIDFAMNDKCAAGTGRFLEVMAQALGVELAMMGRLALESAQEINISSTCTVFAESEVVSLISQGVEPPDIAMAITRAIAHRTAGLARRVGLADQVVMTGGVAKNQAVVKLLAQKIGHEILVPEEPQIIGALGAALFARNGAPE